MYDADYWIKKLNLTKHPEGGYYKEVYKSEGNIEKMALPARYSGERSFATSIYFLLKEDDFSSFHRLQSDEIWHFYIGSTLELHVLGNDGKMNHHLLGQNSEAGENLQFTVPQNHWFGGRLIDKSSFALLGCTLAPGFHFDDFELGTREKMIQEFPQHGQLIKELTFEK